MIGTKLYKDNPNDMDKYSDVAVWCNANNATIEDKGEYYEVVEITAPEPSKEELLAKLETDFLSGQQEYVLATNVARMNDDADLENELKAEYQDFVSAYTEQKKELEEGPAQASHRSICDTSGAEC